MLRHTITKYKSLIMRDWSANTLSHTALPSTSQVLEELSRHMADEVYKRYRLGFAPTLAPLAPLAHPYYPFWMPTYGGNYAIEALVRREEQEALDRQAKDGEKENARYR
jgi:hypothetical protein